ncbi:hypothetical protein [Pseudomonas sp. 210_17 TE3656]
MEEGVTAQYKCEYFTFKANTKASALQGQGFIVERFYQTITATMT